MSQVTNIEAQYPIEFACKLRVLSTSACTGLGKALTHAALGLAFVLSISDHSYAQTPPPYQYQPPPPPAYPAPPEYPPPPAYAEPPAPPPPPGAVWVGAPGQCLYGNGMVYWCAPGVVFDGFPPGWDFIRFPIRAFGPGIIVDPIWFDRWRVGHPGFVFRGRLATEGERRAFAAHRDEIIRNASIRAHDHPAPRPRGSEGER